MKKTFQFFSVLTLLAVLLLGMDMTAQEGLHSIGKNPNAVSSGKIDNSHLLNEAVTTGYGADGIANMWYSVAIPGGTLTTVGPTAGTLHQGGDFDGSGTFYAVRSPATLITVDVTTGVETALGTITGVTGGQTLTSVAWNPSNSTMYLGSTDITTSQLYTIDLTTRVATLVGTVTNCPGLIAVAINCEGMAYGVDIVNDNLVSINTGSGAGTILGPLGFNANFAQDADFDFETGTLYLAAYNGTSSAGELRTADLTTGATTLVLSWGGVELTSFGIVGTCGPPCPIDPPTNPNPPSGATNVSINPGNATWTNGAGATSIEVYFGELGSLAMVYTGAPITSLAIPGPLNYFTTYGWRVVGKNDTCEVSGPTWTFTTEQNPLLVASVDTVYPQAAQFWTGTTNGTAKTDGEVRGANTEDGWFVFDVSGIANANTIVDSIRFYGYVNATNWPYWSATPLPGLNPLTATAAELKTAIEANSATGVAYIFANESSGFTTGWKNYAMGNGANADMEAALSQGWFAMGMDSRDNSATYFINWDGWSQTNVPYLVVYSRYVVPVELTSFTASATDNKVTLNWSTATETNNQGFFVERSNGNEYVSVGFVEGRGTTTEVQRYSYVDGGLSAGTYTYRLKQVDFDGTFEYSNAIEVDVAAPREFTLNQNYPNPFNPSTMITFSLAVDAKVTLKIFDVLGQEVMTLVNNNLSAGAHEYNFDASGLNSGVYFYRVEATGVDGQNFKSVKKMILAK